MTRSSQLGFVLTLVIAGCESAPTDGPLARSSAALFTVGPRMAGARAIHVSARLGSGKTLVAGGATAIVGGLNIVVTNTAEVFDPKTMAFHAVPPMTTKRMLFSASPLPDGRVIVIGGAPGFTAATYTTEIFDETTETWEPGPATGENHAGHVTVGLADGRLLVVAGFTRTRVELYDPSTNTFRDVAPLPSSRGMHTATLLPSGKILVTGGGDDWNKAESTAFLYDLAKDSWNKITPMSTPRIGHTATLLPSGKVLIAGGSSKSIIGNDRLDSAELFDPDTKTFTVVGKMTHVHAFHSAILLPSGAVMIAGGNPDNLLRPNSPFVERWDPITGNFTEIDPMGSPRAAPTVFGLPDGRTLIAGGFGTVALDSSDILTSLALGTACKSNSACESGFCRDGVCCDTRCDGSCEACNEKGACTAVTSGSPRAGHTCDGYACTAAPPPTVGGVCRESCTEDTHCAAGFFCSKGKCEPDNGAKCTTDHSRTKTDNGVEVSCGAYLCEDLEGGKRGRCRSTCASTGECGVGYVCNLETASCDPAASAGPAGASCTLGPSSAPAMLASLVALAALGVRRRRSRPNQSTSSRCGTPIG